MQTHWSYIFLTLTHQYNVISEADLKIGVNQRGSIQLRCPIDTPVSHSPESISVTWSFYHWTNRTKLAKLRMDNSKVETNTTYTARDISISSQSGDLTIRNVAKDDAGLYDCKIKGHPRKTVLLKVSGKSMWCNNEMIRLSHWSRDKMAAIFQTTFSNAFSWIKMYEFRIRFHWNLFPGVQLTMFQNWFR